MPHCAVFTSDHALKMEWVPNWVAIIGSGYIGLEFSDVYTALGSEVRLSGQHSAAWRSCVWAMCWLAGQRDLEMGPEACLDLHRPMALCLHCPLPPWGWRCW